MNLSTILDQIGLQQGELSGQTAIITGAGRGIGREMARALAALGAAVVIAELSDAGIETEQDIRSSGGKAIFIRTDVSNPASVDNLARQALSAFGPVNILINNAIRIASVPVVEMPLETWDQIIAVNLRGAFLTCKALLPEMLTRQSGIILNLVSTDAMPSLSAYIASKQGLTGFTQSLAAEVGDQGIQVIAFAPGMVDTPGIRSVAEELAPHVGLQTEQFLGLSLHPAYAGLMPPEHAGAAAAYLVARLSAEYHGDSVTGYEILERAGLIQRTLVETTTQAEPVTSPGIDLVQLTGKLCKILAETAAEFEKLPVFARPLARSGFKSKAGMSLQDWQRSAETLASLAKQNNGDSTRKEAARLTPYWSRLMNYFQGVPGETARFTKDQELLREVTRLSQERIQVIRELEKAYS